MSMIFLGDAQCYLYAPPCHVFAYVYVYGNTRTSISQKIPEMETYLIFAISLHNRNLRPRNLTLESA